MSFLLKHQDNWLSRLALCLGIVTAMCVVLTGCSSGVEDSPTTSVTPHAILDRDRGDIIFPLDAYGMSPRDEQIVVAAQAVVLWRCYLQSDDLTQPAVDNVNAILASGLIRKEWLYGFWDAPLLASNGPVSMSDWVSPGPTGMDQDTESACWEVDEIKGLGLLSRAWADPDPEAVANQLIRYSAQALASTRSDSRFAPLIETRVACVEARGYSTVDNEIGSVDADPSWSQEQAMEAFLAEAECSDELDITQQAGDINASYEQEIIDAHEGELIAVKAEADRRVATATRILQDAGLL